MLLFAFSDILTLLEIFFSMEELYIIYFMVNLLQTGLSVKSYEYESVVDEKLVFFVCETK